MKATSSSLLKFLSDTMRKLDKGEIETSKALAHAELAKQSNNILKYENDRLRIVIEAEKHNLKYGTNLVLRDIEQH